jgi:hypothetical protein
VRQLILQHGFPKRYKEEKAVVICSFCNKPVAYLNKSGVHRVCYREHLNICIKKLKCDGCGIEFERDFSLAQNQRDLDGDQRRFFHSRRCWYTWRTEQKGHDPYIPWQLRNKEVAS